MPAETKPTPMQAAVDAYFYERAGVLSYVERHRAEWAKCLTVAQLIEHLRALPQDAKVSVRDDCDIRWVKADDIEHDESDGMVIL